MTVIYEGQKAPELPHATSTTLLASLIAQC